MVLSMGFLGPETNVVRSHAGRPADLEVLRFVLELESKTGLPLSSPVRMHKTSFNQRLRL